MLECSVGSHHPRRTGGFRVDGMEGRTPARRYVHSTAGVAARCSRESLRSRRELSVRVKDEFPAEKIVVIENGVDVEAVQGGKGCC